MGVFDPMGNNQEDPFNLNVPTRQVSAGVSVSPTGTGAGVQPLGASAPPPTGPQTAAAPPLSDPTSKEYQAMPQWWKTMQENIESHLNKGSKTLYKTEANSDFWGEKDPLHPLPYILPTPQQPAPRPQQPAPTPLNPLDDVVVTKYDAPPEEWYGNNPPTGFENGSSGSNNSSNSSSSNNSGGSSSSSNRTSNNTAQAAGQPTGPTPLLDRTVRQQRRGGNGLTRKQEKFQETIRNRLLEQMGIAGEIPTINDPILAAQQQAFERGQQRSHERFQNQAAERFSTQGLLNSGARNVADEGFLQQQGEAAGANAAGLVGQDLIRRRSELQNLMGLAVGVQDADLTRDLQERIVAIDAELQQSLGQGDLDLRRLLGLGSLDVQNRGLSIQQLLGLAGIDAGIFNNDTNANVALINAGNPPF